MVSKAVIGIAAIGAVALAVYLIFKGAGPQGAGSGLLSGFGQQAPSNANPLNVAAPTSVQPTSLFTSTPSLTTGGSGSGNFTLAQTYSPYYSSSNTYTNTTTTTSNSNPQTNLKVGLFG